MFYKRCLEGNSAPIGGVEDEENTLNLKEAFEQSDGLFIFLAARETHLFQGAADDPVLIYERCEQVKDYLSKMKHISAQL